MYILWNSLDERVGLDGFLDERVRLDGFLDERVGLDEKERACSGSCRTEQARLYFCAGRGPVYLCHRFLFTPYRGREQQLAKNAYQCS